MQGTIALANRDTTLRKRSFFLTGPFNTTMNGSVASRPRIGSVDNATSSTAPDTAPVTRLPFDACLAHLATVASTLKGHSSLHRTREGAVWKQLPPVTAS